MTPHRLVLAFGLALSLATAAAARQIAVSGPLEVLQIDDFDHDKSRVVYRVRDERTGRQYELDGVSPGLKHGTHVRAQGRLKRGVRRLTRTGFKTLGDCRGAKWDRPPLPDAS